MGDHPEAGVRLRPDPFQEILDAHGAALWRLAGAYTHRLQDREDLYQEILAAVWQGLPRFRGDSSRRTFVFRIGHNRAITFARKARRHGPLDFPEAHPDPRPSPADVTVAKDERERLACAVRALPAPAREVVLLSLEGLPNGEIAQVLGISRSNVAVRLHRARATLRERLDPGRSLDDC